MYPKYFGLKEPSFSIAPDPHYLFLSEQHKEALAHLLYGAGESGGFVLLTGEVGTGKTTVCRAFLEQLPDGVDVALVLNPTQTANELLLNLCDEFGIAVPPGEQSIKRLVDRLNQYLLESHANGRRPVLIIDEAQNLQPQVMEQIRLLTNLETTKHKLLQIFLIGQPELRRMLESEQLRQINQRITARFHLTPFNLRETGDYIRHRVAVAGVDRPLFTARAIRLIYRYSAGIPRLINILCDRALLGTCVTRGSQVTPAIVAKAAREVRGEPLDVQPPSPVARPAFLAVGAFVLALAGGWWGYGWIAGDPGGRLAAFFATPETPAEPAAVTPVTEPPAAEPAVTMATPPAEPVVTTASPIQTAPSPAPAAELPFIPLSSFEGEALNATLDRLALSEAEAMQRLLQRWGVTQELPGRGDPCGRLVRAGLRCAREQGKLSHVRFFDLPALLRVANRDGAGRFVVLSALTETEATLDLATGSERVPVAGLERIWTGAYTLVWQPPPSGATLIGPVSPGEDVRWLRQLLLQVPELGLTPSDSPRFDAALTAALRAFQTSSGLQPDGIAGPRTLIQLSQTVKMPGIPRLSQRGAMPGKEAGTP